MDSVTAQSLSARTLAADQLILTPTESALSSAAGRVQSYDVGPAGLAVRLTAEVAGAAVDQLSGQPVWVTANTGGRLVAFKSVARRLSETSLEMDGITSPVVEHRRGQLRATTRIAAHVRLRGGNGHAPLSLSGHTLDLSRGGCRVRVAPAPEGGAFPLVGSPADVTLELSNRPVTATGEVLRVDQADGQAVLRFTALDAEDAERIERHVLSLVL